MPASKQLTRCSVRRIISCTPTAPGMQVARTLATATTAQNNTSATNAKPRPQQYDWLPYASQLHHSYKQSNLPSTVRIVDVSPRDGLQNEKQHVDTQVKIELIERLVQCGLTYIEATSFVSPKWVPQMSDNSTVLNSVTPHKHVTYPVLIPNEQGMRNALQCSNLTEIAIFASASETFSHTNINCSIADSLQRFAPINQLAKQHNIRVRGYVSCVLGCPYEGPIQPDAVNYVTQKLLELGCYEVSLGDTIGIGNAGSTTQLLQYLLHRANIDSRKLAVHFHDTYGQALNNIYIALQHNISVVDASVSGLGGCPYAKGASGNVATEDVVYMLNGLGINTGIDLTKLVETSVWISQQLDRTPASKISKTFGSKLLSSTTAQTQIAVGTAHSVTHSKSESTPQHTKLQHVPNNTLYSSSVPTPNTTNKRRFA